MPFAHHERERVERGVHSGTRHGMSGPRRSRHYLYSDTNL